MQAKQKLDAKQESEEEEEVSHWQLLENNKQFAHLKILSNFTEQNILSLDVTIVQRYI
eukprot:SAG11_NODE_6897_length_1229_cov_1.943363_2_plen_58_part_00